MRRVPSFFHSSHGANEKIGRRLGRLDFSPFDLRIEPVSQDLLQALADKHPDLPSIGNDLRASAQWSKHDCGDWCIHDRRQSRDRRNLDTDEQWRARAGDERRTENRRDQDDGVSRGTDGASGKPST